MFNLTNPAVFEELLTKVMFAPFCVMVPEVEINALEIFIAPELRDKPFELFNVKLYKLLVPEPEIDWELEPSNVIVGVPE